MDTNRDDKELENEEDLSEEETLEEDESFEEAEDLSDANEVLKEKEEQLLRLRADFANYKKRNEKEKKGLVNYGIEQVIEDVLPVIDNFERALDCEEDEKDGFYDGVKMIYKQLLDVLKKNNIEEIEAFEKPFDPNFHYAVAMEDSEEYEEGIVLDVIQKGYILGEKVIRPAMVRVAQ